MFVSSATIPIGRTPASTAEATPRIQVTRVGTWRFGSVFANHFGMRPSRLIENQTREAPSMNVIKTVTMPTMAPIAMTFATPPSPTEANADEKPGGRVDVVVLYFCCR